MSQRRCPVPRLLYVTDPPSCREDLQSVTRRACARGADVVLRWPGASDKAVHELGLTLLPIVEAAGQRLLVNDRVDLSLALGAHGVHLKSDGLAASDVRRLFRERQAAGALLGRSAHSAEDLRRAEAESDLDYVTLGPVAPSPGKEPMGFDGLDATLRDARQDGDPLRLAWLALGGVGPGDLPRVDALAIPGERCGLAAIRAFQQPE